MRSDLEIEQRDALLLSIDRVIYTALGRSWTAGQHVKLKAILIAAVDKELDSCR
jgi:hypothetical protein